MLASLVYAIFGFISLVIGLRFVLLLIGANPASAAVSWIYNWSEPFVAPFVGMFGQQPDAVGPGVAAQSIFDWTALIALVIYLLIAAVLGRLFARSAVYHH